MNRKSWGVVAVGFCSLLVSSSYGRAQTSEVVPQGTMFRIPPAAGQDMLTGRPSIAGDGTNFFVVACGPVGARVSHNGVVLDPDGIVISSTHGGCPSVAFDGTNYLVVWNNNSFGNEIFGARVSTSGTVLDAQPIQITTGGDPKLGRPIAIAFDGTNYLIAWRTGGDTIMAMRATTSGVSLDGPTGFGIGSGFYPWAAFDGTNFIVVWHTHGNGLDIVGTRIAPDGGVLGGFGVSNAPEDQDHSSVACGSGNCLVVWHDTQGGADDGLNDGTARGARLSPNGVVLDDPALVIADNVRGQVPVVVAFDGTDYLVAWQVDMTPAKFRLVDVFGRRVSTNGTILDSQAIPIATSYAHQFGPRIAYDGNKYLAAWSESLSGGRCTCVYGQLLERQALSTSTALILARDESLPSPSSASHPQMSTSSWAAEPSPTDMWITAVYGVDSNHAYAVGEGGASGDNPLLRFDGNAWSVWTRGPFDGFRGRQFGLWAAAPDEVWFVGWCGDLFHYDGQTLQASNCQAPTVIGYGVWGSDPSSILTIGTHGGFAHFNGVDVTLQGSTGLDLTLWDVWASSMSNIYAVGEGGIIFRYDGVNWTRQPGVPTVQNLNAIWGTTSDIFAVGDFGTIVHFDGSTWTVQSSGTLEHLFGVWGFSPANVYAVGFNGTILHYDGNAWTPQASGTTRHLLDVGIGGNIVWAVGDQGTILRKAGSGELSSSFRGRVRDKDGNAIADATVAAFEAEVMRFSASSAADGRYNLAVAGGTYHLVASKGGFFDKTRAGQTIADNQILTGVHFRLFRHSFFQGTVRDADTSAPLGGVLIQARQDGVVKFSTTTALDGSYSLLVKKGTYRLRASQPGYRSQTKRDQKIGDGKTKTGVNFRLNPQ